MSETEIPGTDAVSPSPPPPQDDDSPYSTNPVLHRAEAMRAIYHRFDDEGQRIPLEEALLAQWVGDDISHLAAAQSAAPFYRDLARNCLDYPPYRSVLRVTAPHVETQVAPQIDVLRIRDFMAANAPLPPEAIEANLGRADVPLRTHLADDVHMRAIDADLREQLRFIPPSRYYGLQATIARVMGRSDAGPLEQRATEIERDEAERGAHWQANNPENRERDAQAVADFIASNQELLSWKVIENVQLAEPSLRRVLADTARMRQIKSAVEDKLKGLHPSYVSDVQAVIARTLGREDAPALADQAKALRDDLAALRRTQSPPEPSPLQSTPDQGAPSATTMNGMRGSAVAEPALAPSEGAPAAAREHTSPADLIARAKQTSLSKATDLPPDEATAAKAGETHDRLSPARIGNLLERVTYESRADGTVAYLLDGRAAFVDYGDQITLNKGADQSDDAILAAILIAKEKYHGSFEFTGDDTFKQRAVEILVRYRIDVMLKNPTQDAMYRDLKRAHTLSRQDAPQTPIRPAAQADSAAETEVQTREPASPRSKKETVPQPTASRPAETAPSERVEGKVRRLGSAPFEHDPAKRNSFFVELEAKDGSVRTLWGIDLARACRKAAVACGDYVELHSLGKKPVELPATTNADGVQPAAQRRAYKVIWEATALRKATAPAADDVGPHSNGSADHHGEATDGHPRAAPDENSAVVIEGRTRRDGKNAAITLRQRKDGNLEGILEIDGKATEVLVQRNNGAPGSSTTHTMLVRAKGPGPDGGIATVLGTATRHPAPGNNDQLIFNVGGILIPARLTSSATFELRERLGLRANVPAPSANERFGQEPAAQGSTLEPERPAATQRRRPAPALSNGVR